MPFIMYVVAVLSLLRHGNLTDNGCRASQFPPAHAAAVGKDEVGSLLKEATASIEARRFQDAIIALKKILELDPGNPDAHVQLGRAQANLGNLEAAEVRITMRRINTQKYRMIEKLDFLTSQGLYLQALQHDPDYAPATTALGKLYL